MSVVCAEWDRGGLPLWLDRIPGMKVRSNNELWKQEMDRILSIMVNLVRPYFASNGGPIIMAQIENEYTGHDTDYVAWISQLARRLAIGIPWTMCNGAAAVNTIPSCNDNDCFQFAENQSKSHPSQPLIWTENEAWYEKWATNSFAQDEQNDQRSPENVAYVVARWFAAGGAMHNYYVSRLSCLIVRQPVIKAKCRCITAAITLDEQRLQVSQQCMPMEPFCTMMV